MSAHMYDLILKNGSIVTPTGMVQGDIAVKDSKIIEIGTITHNAKDIIDCTGLHILPGVIDTQVHFRDPGLTHKEDLSTGTLSAIFGGVTTILDMPNTDPLTLTPETFADKIARAAGRTFCDYGFFIGGSVDNFEQLPILEVVEGCPGVKVFMGSSTGSLLTADDETLLKILQNGKYTAAFHAEDNDRLSARKHIAEGSGDVHDHPHWRDAETSRLAVERLIKLARLAQRKIHILHITAHEEIPLLVAANDICTFEITPQHLTFSAPDCYTKMGTRAQMNPPIREQMHQDALWEAVNKKHVFVIGSDHAPHTLDEKQKPYPQSPSGMPGVQTTLPVMLNHVHHGKLSLTHLVDLLSHNPASLYRMKDKGQITIGYDADFAIVDLNKTKTITDEWIKSKCGWTPYDGMSVTGWVMGTILRGQVVMWDDQLIPTIGKNPPGKPVRFHYPD